MSDRPADREWSDRRWRRTAVILAIFVLGIGCSPMSAFYFLWPQDPKFQPECPLTCEKKKETKIVVLASSSLLDPRPESYGAEQDLAERLIQVVKKYYEEEKEKVKIVPHYMVRDFHNKNPNPLTPYEVGKHFQADKVVYLEVDKLSLYKEGSARQLFFGHVEMTVTVTDMSKEREESRVFDKPYIQDYPRTGEIMADGSNPAFFRAQFLNHVANDLSRRFIPYETKNRLEAPNDI
jgi:hypothetical protein